MDCLAVCDADELSTIGEVDLLDILDLLAVNAVELPELTVEHMEDLDLVIRRDSNKIATWVQGAGDQWLRA